MSTFDIIRSHSIEELEDAVQMKIFIISDQILEAMISNFSVRLRHIHSKNGMLIEHMYHKLPFMYNV